ncbi:hypothetical protein NITHO_1780008 [Nitrolancea hollandica Lb]|uniref:Uncharacterized protein n=1 Tax=Nitrolancea hollandica Lb TaxID=1129897 RepID=I4EED0_9BACT|nr:hypothetical protein NITHO_1780008 [Nitrolancea hollandica Lb]
MTCTMEGKSQNVCPERATSPENTFRKDGDNPIGVELAGLRGIETHRLAVPVRPQRSLPAARTVLIRIVAAGSIRTVTVSVSDTVCLRATECLVFP